VFGLAIFGTLFLGASVPPARTARPA